MPNYDYVCSRPVEDGGHGEFEEFHSIKTKLEECPKCRSEKDISTPVQRLISGGSGRGIVELSGDEYKASVAKDAERIKRETYASESKYSNIIGESRYESIQQRMDKQRR